MESLPYGSMQTVRHFAIPLFLCLSEIFGKWVNDAASAAVTLQSTSADAGILGAKTNMSKAMSLCVLVASVDEDSEVHRFVTSSVCANRKCAQRELSKLEKLKKDQEIFPPKTRHDKRM